MSEVGVTETLPRTIGRYEIRKEIGRGMMGIVYEAHDPALGRRIALKTIGLAFAVAEEDRKTFEKRFLAEARIAARLSHPGIVVVHDAGQDPETGTLFMALEYLEGHTLGEVIKQHGAVPWREALRLAGRVAEALHHAHSNGVIHRDVKPANIMVLPSGEPKIMDFGIAKIETARIKLTSAGQSFGTPLYMSPEQALGQEIDGRADIFSLGAIAYTLLTGQLAFAGANIPHIIKRVVQEDPTPPSRLVPELPEAADYVVARALAKDPRNRYADGETLAQDIEDLLAGRAPRHRARWAGVSVEGTMVSPPTLPQSEDDLFRILLEQAPSERGAPQPVAGAESPLAALVPEARAGVPAAPLPGRGEPAVERAGEARRLPQAPVRAVGAPAPPKVAPRTPLATFLRAPAALLVFAAVGTAVLVGYLRRPAKAPRTQAAEETRAPAPSSASESEAPAAEKDGGARKPPPDPTTAPTEARRATSTPEGPPIAGPPPAASSPALSDLPEPARAPEPAQLAIDFEHPLKSGVLRIWVDRELVLEEPLESRVTKKVVALKFRKGRIEDTLELSPGKHEVRVQVAWDDKQKTESLSGNFGAGSTRRLEIRMGRLRKNLSLEWK